MILKDALTVIKYFTLAVFVLSGLFVVTKFCLNLLQNERNDENE
jgi:hypothetical protein